MSVKRFFLGLSEKIFAALFAIMLIQTPIFMQAYLNVLRGAHLEVKKSITSLEDKAKISGYTLKDYIDVHITSKEKAFHNTGKYMQETLERYLSHHNALIALEKSNLWERPIIFLQNIEWDLVKVVKFTPGIHISLETFLYLVIGVLLGMLVHFLFISLPLGKLTGGSKKSGPNPGRGYRQPGPGGPFPG